MKVGFRRKDGERVLVEEQLLSEAEHSGHICVEKFGK